MVSQRDFFNAVRFRKQSDGTKKLAHVLANSYVTNGNKLRNEFAKGGVFAGSSRDMLVYRGAPITSDESIAFKYVVGPDSSADYTSVSGAISAGIAARNGNEHIVIKILAGEYEDASINVPSNCTIYGLGPVSVTGDILVDDNAGGTVNIYDIALTGNVVYQFRSLSPSLTLKRCELLGTNPIDVSTSVGTSTASSYRIQLIDCNIDAPAITIDAPNLTVKAQNCKITTANAIGLSCENIVFQNCDISCDEVSVLAGNTAVTFLGCYIFKNNTSTGLENYLFDHTVGTLELHNNSLNTDNGDTSAYVNNATGATLIAAHNFINETYTAINGIGTVQNYLDVPQPIAGGGV